MLKLKAIAVLAIAVVALVISANVTAMAANVNPWFGFATAFVVFPLAIVGAEHIRARIA